MERDRKTSRSGSRSSGRSSDLRSRHAGTRADEVTSADLRQTANELLRILLLRRWVFFVPFCLATAAAFIASHYVPRTYEAHTTFEQANDPVSVNLPPTLVTSTFGYFLSTLEQDIKSEKVMGPIVEELGLAQDLPRNPDGSLTQEGLESRERMGRALAQGVQVVAWQKSPYRNVIDLRYTGGDPMLKTRLIGLMKEGYKQLVRAKVAEKLEDARAWYAEQAQRERGVVEEIDGRLTTLRMEYPDLDPANPFSISMQLASLRNRLAELQRARGRVAAQIAARQEFIAAAANQPPAGRPADNATPGVVLSPAAQRLQASLEASEGRVLELKLTRGMTERHPDIVAERELQQRYARQLLFEMQRQGTGLSVNRAVKAVEGFVARPIHGLWRPVMAQAEMELASLAEERKQSTDQIKATEQRIAELAHIQGQVVERRQEFSRLEEELERAREDYDTYQGLVSQCDRGLTVENQNRGILFTDVVPAGGGSVPASPLAKTVLLLSLLAGVATGTLFVVIAELFDRRFRTLAQVTRALGLPILECIDEIVTPPERRRRFLRRAVLVPAVTTLLVGMVGVSGGLSYLSLNRPEAYQRVMRVPRSAWAHVAGPIDQGAEAAPGDRPV